MGKMKVSLDSAPNRSAEHLTENPETMPQHRPGFEAGQRALLGSQSQPALTRPSAPHNQHSQHDCASSPVLDICTGDRPEKPEEQI